jgi:hypothetical protein
LQDPVVQYGARGAGKKLLFHCVISGGHSAFFKGAECPHRGSAEDAYAAVGVAIDNAFNLSAKRRAYTRLLSEVRILWDLG